MSELSVQVLPVSSVRRNRYNPRQDFDAAKLAELAASVRRVGILQPLVVRPVNGHFELVAAERRFRAAELAGLADVPCVVREMTDIEVLAVVVLENLQLSAGKAASSSFVST